MRNPTQSLVEINCVLESLAHTKRWEHSQRKQVARKVLEENKSFSRRRLKPKGDSITEIRRRRLTMGISGVTSEISGGNRQDLEEELTLRRREGPLFARASLAKTQFGGFQKDSNSNRIADTSSYSQEQTFSNVLTKQPGPRGFSSNTCSSCSFCMKNTCACKSSNCVTCVTAENLPKRGWSSRGPPEEIYKYF